MNQLSLNEDYKNSHQSELQSTLTEESKQYEVKEIPIAKSLPSTRKESNDIMETFIAPNNSQHSSPKKRGRRPNSRNQKTKFIKTLLDMDYILSTFVKEISRQDYKNLSKDTENSPKNARKKRGRKPKISHNFSGSIKPKQIFQVKQEKNKKNKKGISTFFNKNIGKSVKGNKTIKSLAIKPFRINSK